MTPLNILLTLLATLTLTTSTPLRAPTLPISPSTPRLHRRSPVSATSFSSSDWPTNIVMVGGAETYGMWIPQDGQWHETYLYDCLDVPAYNIVNCAGVTIDYIGVASGYGPCSLTGVSGWSATLDGGSGYVTVGPPQLIVAAMCEADSD
jgi:hypothetical protein